MKYYRKIISIPPDYEYNVKYYKETKDKKVEISKDDYFKYVRSKLRKSKYPDQDSDFYLLKMPEKLKDHKNFTKNEIPIDWLLKNIVLYFWDLGIMTQNLDQGDRDYYQKKDLNPGFIRFYYDRRIINIIKKINKKSVSYEIEKVDGRKYIFLRFNQSDIPYIHKKLGLEIPNFEEAYAGDLLERKIISKDKIIFSDYENEFSGIIEYPDFLT